MRLRQLARLVGSRRLSVAAIAMDAARAMVAGRRRTALRLAALALLASRSTLAGIAVELGWRLVRRWRRGRPPAASVSAD